MKVSRKRIARREDGKMDRQCLFILDFLHGSGFGGTGWPIWLPLTMLVPGL
jgi:hypothetical protein